MDCLSDDRLFRNPEERTKWELLSDNKLISQFSHNRCLGLLRAPGMSKSDSIGA